ncbi:hypothetical protein SEPCBS57363_002801 [Sporothrix epigloea]|uniref:Bud22 domain-containing protein n=1 Tax=Sporothrix epigloea TaxID=1892477 RepID=A0ABP0DJ82_9PEZI
MLKRKRFEFRPPPTKGNGDSAYGASAPPNTPQPQKAVAAFEASYAEVLRALKKARGFERQRIAKRMLGEKKQAKGGKKVKTKAKSKSNAEAAAAAATADPHGEPDSRANTSEEHLKRFEREMQVLKELDYEVSARVHLANAMMRTRDLAEAPGPLGAHLQLASEVLSQRIRAYRTEDIHNVTSALYNRPFVRDAVVKAVRSMCQLLGVPPPDKNAGRQSRGKGDSKDKRDKTVAGENAVGKETQINTRANTGNPNSLAIGKDDEADDTTEEKEDNTEYSEKDDEEIERELAKYDSMLGGSGGEESASDDSNDSENDSDDGLDDDDVVAKLRAKYKAAVAKGLWRDDGNEISDEEDGSDDDEDNQDGEDADEDEFAGFSTNEDDGSDDEEELEDHKDATDEYSSESESDSDDDLRPRKRAATSSSVGGSHFLPSLMGGYVSDGDDGTDDGGRRATIADDEAAAERMLGGPRKNRRGQRARQAIWEKKYKLLAKHMLESEKTEKTNDKKGKKDSKDKTGKSGGWDAKRGAVDASDAPRWMRRKMGLTGRVGPMGGGGSAKTAQASKVAGGSNGKTNNPNANAQVSGTLHPSWEAARKAKDKAQTAAFEGKKIVFD